jgi:uncharacterized membrane protein (TIGR02234 family)
MTAASGAGLRGAALLAGAGGAALLAAAGAWVTGTVPAPPPLPAQDVSAAAPGSVRALGVVVLAGVAALFATRRAGRVVVGALLLLAGLAAAAVALGVLADPSGALPDDATGSSATARPLLALAGALPTALAGGLTVARGRSWPALGRRYEAPAARPPASRDEPPALWDALDRGEDPTR